MKLTKTASGKTKIKISKKEWLTAGKRAGWIKRSSTEGIVNDPDWKKQAAGLYQICKEVATKIPQEVLSTTGGYSQQQVRLVYSLLKKIGGYYGTVVDPETGSEFRPSMMESMLFQELESYKVDEEDTITRHIESFVESIGWIIKALAKNSKYWKTNSQIEQGENEKVEAISKDSPEFEKWFSGSKIVDSSGGPLEVYHGTTGNFSEFQLSQTGAYGPGVYLTDSEKVARSYAPENLGGKVLSLYLKIFNPFVIKGQEEMNQIEEIKGQQGLRAIRKVLANRGYDGIIDHVGWKSSSSVVYVAFLPSQVKFALK